MTIPTDAPDEAARLREDEPLDLEWAYRKVSGQTFIALVRKALKEKDDDLTTLRARLEQVEGALRPFADYADGRFILPDNFVITVGSPIAKRQLTMGDCYRARAALTPPARDKGDGS